MNFTDKNALITGGVSGIGAAICEEFLQNGIKGVALIDIQDDVPGIVVQWREKFPNQMIKYFCCDVADEDDLKKYYKKIIDVYENIEIVVNSAGIMNENQLAKMININLTGLIHSSLLALDHMRADRNGKGGFVINISSIAGLEPFHNLPSYSATKHGVVAFTKCLMNNYFYERMSVKFLIICPGGTRTPLLSGLMTKMFSIINTDLDEKTKDIKIQEPAAVGRAVIEVLSKKEPKGIWIIDHDKLREASTLVQL